MIKDNNNNNLIRIQISYVLKHKGIYIIDNDDDVYRL